MTLDRASGFAYDDSEREAFGNVSSFGPTGQRFGADVIGVPDDYVLYYEPGVGAVTIRDYVDSVGAAGFPQLLYSGMTWDEFNETADNAVYQMQKAFYSFGQRSTPPYNREQFERDANNLADFDDSADLRRVGFENPFVSGGGGARRGRGRGSAAAPNYRPPDAAALREQIKMYVVATTGTARSDIIDKAVKAYMDADRQAFDNALTDKGEQVDPFQSVKSVVRGSSIYKQIHRQRPESVDELDWVTSRQGKLRSLGLSAERAESLGVGQATVAANDEALVGAAEMQFNADTGRMLASQRDRLKRAGSAAMGLL